MVGLGDNLESEEIRDNFKIFSKKMCFRSVLPKIGGNFGGNRKVEGI